MDYNLSIKIDQSVTRVSTVKTLVAVFNIFKGGSVDLIQHDYSKYFISNSNSTILNLKGFQILNSK